MRAGLLKHTIEFWTKTNTRDEYSGFTEEFVKSFSRKAQIKSSTGGEQLISDQVFPLYTKDFVIRYKSGIVETMRIKYNSEFYNILSIEEPKFRRTLVIKSVRVI